MVGQVGFTNNFLNPTGFRFVIKRLPHVSFYVQGANVPGISIGTTEQATPFKTIYYHGDKINYNTFSVSIRLDEYMKSFTEIKNWMEGLTSPDNFRQYANLAKDPNGDNLYSDATLAILDSRGNVSIEIGMKDIFPINIGDIVLNVTDQDINYISLDVTFQTMGFDVNIIKEKVMYVPPGEFEISVTGDLDSDTFDTDANDNIYVPQEGDEDYVAPLGANVQQDAINLLGDLYDSNTVYTSEMIENILLGDGALDFTPTANDVISIPKTTSFDINDTSFIVDVRNDYPGDYTITATDMVQNHVDTHDPDLLYYTTQFIEFDVYAPGHPFQVLDANNELVANTEIINNASDNETILWQPKTAGIYTYQCSVHPNMTGTITIEDNADWVATDDIANVSILETEDDPDAGKDIVTSNGSVDDTYSTGEGSSGGGGEGY